MRQGVTPMHSAEYESMAVHALLTDHLRSHRSCRASGKQAQLDGHAGHAGLTTRQRPILAILVYGGAEPPWNRSNTSGYVRCWATFSKGAQQCR